MKIIKDVMYEVFQQEGHALLLTEAEAKELYVELHKLFGNKEAFKDWTKAPLSAEDVYGPIIPVYKGKMNRGDVSDLSEKEL